MKRISTPLIQFLIIIFLFTCVGCIQDDHHSQDEIESEEQNVHGIQQDASVYPHILEYISQKTNGTMLYSIADTNILPITNNSLRIEDFGMVDTSSTISISDEDKTKYSFKMINQESSGSEFINMVVIEQEDYLKDYFIKYDPNTEWLEQQGSVPDMSTYSGLMKIYDYSGNLLS